MIPCRSTGTSRCLGGVELLSGLVLLVSDKPAGLSANFLNTIVFLSKKIPRIEKIGNRVALRLRRLPQRVLQCAGGTILHIREHVRVGVQRDRDADLSVNTLGAFVSHWYPRWNQELYRELLVRYEVDPYKRFDKLSRGDQRRLTFALALAQGTELLLLDEPTAGVDPFGRKEMLEDISRFVHLGAGVKTVVFATHVMEEARRVADHVVLLADGKSLGLHEKRTLLKGWKTFWVDRVPGGDVPGVVEVKAGSPTCIVTNSPEETAKALFSENVQIVYEGPVDLEKVLSHLSRAGAGRGAEHEAP